MRVIFRSVLILVVATFFYFVFSPREARFNVHGSATQPDGFSLYRGKPGIYKLQDGKVKTINRFGYISSPDIPLARTTNSLRIAFLGESSTAGTGFVLSDSETWPARVAAKLQERFPFTKIEFINAALGGYTSFESYGAFWSRIRFFRPDIVILNHGWNDMYYFNPEGGILATSLESQNTERNFALGSSSKLLAPLLASLGGVFSRGWETERSSSKELKPFNPKSVRTYEENLRLFLTSTSALGIRLFVIRQPTLIVPNLSEKLKRNCHTEFHAMSFESHLQAFDQIYQSIDTVIPKQSIIDLTSLSGQGDLFADHIHPTPAGAERIATLVATFLSKSLKISR